MKKLIALIFFSVLVIAVAIFAVRYYLYVNEKNSNNDIEKISEEDRVAVMNLLSSFVKTVSSFEERYYEYLIDKLKSNTELKSFERTPLTSTLNASTFTSKTVFDEVTRLTEYLNNVMQLKLAVADNNFDMALYSEYFNAIEFNYISAAASIDILIKALKFENTRIFLPEEVAVSVINTKKCFSSTAADSYEDTMRWYIENTSLRAAFDKEFYKVIFARDIFNHYDINKIYKKMKTLYSIMPDCSVPVIFEEIVTDDDYKKILDVYEDKLELVKYILESKNLDDEDIIEWINKIYSAKNFNNMLALGLGMNSFHTLGEVIVFELYSKTYDTTMASQILPIQ